MPTKSTIILSACLFALPAAQANEGEQLFSLHVKSILSEKCFGCHGGDKIKGELDVTTREGLLKGGETSSKVLIPGDPKASLLMTAVRWEEKDYEMPPKANDRLTEKQIARLQRWVKLGAPWPTEEKQAEYVTADRARVRTEEGIIIPTSGGLGAEWTYRRYVEEDLWAFQPIAKVAPPAPGNPIDAFVGKKLTEAGFKPAPAADARTFLRRATLDLTGLPPTPEEIEAFQKAYAANADQAVEALVDRLLASPHYGERWAQHWLDVTRYADTGGYSNDYERSNGWRYRDYVIRSFNNDKPYDEFVVEQLAGDELADDSYKKRTGADDTKAHQNRIKGDYTPEESEWLVASSFLRMGPWDNAMVKAPEARQMYLDDVVNAVGQTFLSTTMRCFKCHDHKFDPLPTRDYYRMYATFAATQMAERKVPFHPTEKLDGFKEGKEFVTKMHSFATKKRDVLTKKREDAARAWYEERGKPYVSNNERKGLPDEEKPPRNVGLDHIAEGRLKVREQDEWIWNRRLERYQPMAQSVYNGADPPDVWNKARKLRVEKGYKANWRPDSVVYTGGSLEAKGEKVGPGVLSGLGLPVEGAPADDPYVLPDSLNGRRLGLANWVANSRNPLTSRSIVNRVWQHHFVNPIARNPNNFGAKGQKPTHPELLDWLASDFSENGWTFKRLHKLIMTSATYRQAASHPAAYTLGTKDPDNRLLAYQPTRRLTAEELRDGMLQITGELNPTLGGLPSMPEINMEVALQPRMIQFSLAPAYQPSPTPDQRNRRSIYAYRVRGQADPFMELFNQPSPNESCDARDTAAVSPQVFTLMNSDIITDRSIAFAKSLQKSHADKPSQLAQAFRKTLGRIPDKTELERLTSYLGEMQAYHSKVDPPAVEYPTEITRSLVEEFSGLPFEYNEILPTFENYQPDTKANQIPPETRALADLCVLLFNANEFIYVY